MIWRLSMDPRSDLNILSRVVTVSEICIHWGLHQSTVMMAIYRDKLEARQAGKEGSTWLVTRASVEKLYGKPYTPLNGD